MSLETAPSSLRERQIANLKRMLHLNVRSDIDLVSSTNEEELVWKVLVLDQRSTAIVSSVLRVNDLLEYGITMHSLITQKRAALPDVPVIYFVEPSAENIARIITDLENEHYADYYVNFTSSLSRSLLEEFAKKVALSGKAGRIKQVFDQYLDFVVTEPNLFSLDLPNVYSQFNNPKTTESDITSIADRIANGLFAAVLTMGSVPIIRSNRGGPAELISQRLDQKLRDHVINTRQGASTSLQHSTADRMVLVLLDRNIDLASMFAHSWIYQCMVSDVFKLDRNTIEIRKTLAGDKTEIKRLDIDPKDFFWNDNASLPFPDAVENVESELSKYTKEAREITAKTGYSSIKEIDPSDQRDTLHIQEAIKALPELTQRKNIIDMHMTVLTELIKELDSKNLDAFFEVEQNVGNPATQKRFLELLKAQTKSDNHEDKLRTYIMLTLTSDLPKSFCDECEKALEELHCDLTPLKYIKQVKELTKLSSMNLSEAYLNTESSASSGNKGALFSNLSSKLMGLTEGSSKLSEGFGSLISGLKNLLPEKKNLPVTNIVESIMSPANANQESLKMTDDYLYFDPNLTRGSHSKPPKRSSYNEAMVFIVGGCNYLEYSNLQDWCNRVNETAGISGAPQKLVCYGSTEIVTAEKFLKECSELGKQL
ncbi:Protein SLY1 [Ogataea parapolymorpha DL-1]|uniref:Protein SLY1 n=1 Tax=Ogataea parapolymorpha (strain ATCC 26012 / BCRC 20466 / JCM 22074 / NRRL Y-7560 / DL-1) TaxID=871575 RepID=W1QLJ2_OGAPD|nr:Protein SLY1 [Ogataea parapolymorpha DL-1]ESX02296.1 Protein SLY1 [Ogataea parapolymorpha DL-1]